MIFVHGLNSLRQTFPIRKSEWVCAAVLFGMALVLRLNPDLFAERSGYEAMARFAPQWIWQWALFVIGIGRLAVLLINGAWWRTPHLRSSAAFFSCFAWWQIAAGLAGNLGIGVVAFAGFFLLDALNFRQAFIEAGASEGLKTAERRSAKHIPDQ